MRVACLAQKHNAVLPHPGLERGPPNPESRRLLTLTILYFTSL